MKITNEIFNCDIWSWSSFGPDLVATFIGFILAILAALFCEWLFNRYRTVQMIKNLVDEIREIIAQLKMLNPDEDLFPPPIDITIWDNISSSNNRMIYTRKWYKEVSKFYKRVMYVNELYSKKSEYFLLAFGDENKENQKIVNKYESIYRVFLNHIKEILYVSDRALVTIGEEIIGIIKNNKKIK